MTSIASLDDLIALGRYRWTVPLLTDLAAHNGARFIELLHRLRISRESLSRTLEATSAAGWIIRNPGHGHPLRPEYLLSAEGMRLADKATAIDAAQRTIGLQPAKLNRWSLPVVCSIAHGNQRFNDLARTLPPVGPRALSQSLRALTEQQLVTRDLLDEYPPASSYSLTNEGWMLAKAA